MSYRNEVAAVKRLTKRIEQSEAEAEAAKWERAERLARMCEEATQTQVAEDVGLHRRTVGHAVAIWRKFGHVRVQRRPRYADADYEVAGRGPAQRPEAPAKIAERVASTPEIAQAISKNSAALDAVNDAARESVPRVVSGVTQDVPNQILEGLLSMRRTMRRLLDLAEGTRLTKAHRNGYRQIADPIHMGLDVLVGGADLDDELMALLSEEA